MTVITTKPTGTFIHIPKNAGVAITPGLDFGIHAARQHVRFAYTTSLDNLQEGVKRLRLALTTFKNKVVTK